MLVYLVEKIYDFDYGYRKVVKVLNNEKSARNYVNDQPDIGDARQELECVRELQAELEAIDYDSLYIKQIQERYCIEYK